MSLIFIVEAFIVVVLGVTIHLLINEKDKRKDIDALVALKDETSILAELSYLSPIFKLGVATAFFFSIGFVLNYMTGQEFDSMDSWSLVTWLFFAVGVMFTLFITLKQANLYLEIKGGLGVGLITAVFVMFALLSELTNPMESSDRKVRQRSVESPVFQEALKAIGSSGSQASNYAEPLAQARAELAKDTEYLNTCSQRYKAARLITKCKNGNKREIAEDKALIKTYEELMVSEASQNQTATSNAIKTAKKLEHSDQHQAAFVRFLIEKFKISAVEAIFLFALLIITAFEIALHFSGNQVAVRKQALKEMGNKDITYNAELKRERRAKTFKSKLNKIHRENLTTDDYSPSTKFSHNQNTGTHEKQFEMFPNKEKKKLVEANKLLEQKLVETNKVQEQKLVEANKVQDKKLVDKLSEMQKLVAANKLLEQKLVESDKLQEQKLVAANKVQEQKLVDKLSEMQKLVAANKLLEQKLVESDKVQEQKLVEANKVQDQKLVAANKVQEQKLVATDKALTDGQYEKIRNAILSKQIKATFPKMQEFQIEQGMGDSNTTRRAFSEITFNRLIKENKMIINPEWTDPKCGRVKYVLV